MTIRGTRTHHNPTYESWRAMIRRCTKPSCASYPNYGGRGIKVCDDWLEYKHFLKDMGKRPLGMTLDRIDNDGNYELSNCKWSTVKEQNRNQRNSKLSEATVRLIRNDPLRPQTLLASKYGISQQFVSRILKGEAWS